MEEKKEPSTILVVDDEANVCVALKQLLKQEFSILTATSARAALEIVRKNQDKEKSRIDLVLTDISMAKMDGLELLKRIKDKNPQVEVIMITGNPTTETTIAAMRLGAMDYIVKPFNTEDVLKSVHKAIEKRKDYFKVKNMIDDLQTAVQRNYTATTEALILTIDAKDHYTKEHCARVAAYMVLLAQEIGLKPEEQEVLRKIALIHDIGKIGVREDILNNPGALTAEDWDEMKHHAFIGYQIVQPIEFLGSAREVLLYHQEKYDGTGYPAGLKGKEIPLGARMLSIADSFDAMTTDRPYRKALKQSVAIAELKKGGGIQFDPELVGIFIGIIQELENKKGDV